MAEPSTTASAVGLGLSSGLLGAAMIALGISWPLVLWGILGCVVGLSWAPTVGRARAAALFAAAALLSAKGGAVAAAMMGYSEATSQGIAAVLGIGFHPAITAFVKAIPEQFKKRLA